MAFCPNCGTQTDGRFCPNCGADIGPSAASSGPSGGPNPGAAWNAPPPPGMASAGLSDNAASALCYLAGFITGIIFLVISPYSANRRVRFNAWQSIFLSLSAIIINWVLRILIWSILHLYFIGSGFLGLVSLGWFILWLYVIINTYNGKTIKLPVIGDFAEKQS